MQIAHFKLEVEAPDMPTDQRRWNGEPMPSAEASAALHAAVESFRNELLGRGFNIRRTGYGVSASEGK